MQKNWKSTFSTDGCKKGKLFVCGFCRVFRHQHTSLTLKRLPQRCKNKHPQLVHALSRQEDTATSSSVTTNLCHMTTVEAATSGCLCVRLHNSAAQHPAKSLRSESKQQWWPLSASHLHQFPLFYFYTVLLSTRWSFIITDKMRKWNWQLCFLYSFFIVYSNTVTD